MRRLIEELKRRNVLRAAALYAAAAWLLVQVATQVFPFFDMPNSAVRLVVVTAVVGFPFAMVISWFYELTRSGFRREIEPGQSSSSGIWSNRAFRLALFAAAGAGIAVMISSALLTRRYATDAVAGISVAVMPFRNLSADNENAYFAEGIQNEILTRLTEIGALRVISRTSTEHYASAPDDLPKIANDLGVTNILEGSVQRHGDDVRINVQLIQASTDANVWSETYDRKLTDVFAAESEVARAIAASLKARLTGAERRALDAPPTANAEAYDQFLRGLAFELRSFESANLVHAAKYLRRAVELDPNFALALARLAQVDASIAYQGLEATPGLCDKAGAEAAQALQLNPQLGQAHLAQGYFYYQCRSDLDRAQLSFEHARLLLPGSSAVLEAKGNIERRRGNREKAAGYFEEAAQLDPRNTELLGNHASLLVEMRRFDDARALTDKALNVTPDDSTMMALRVFVYQAEGRIAQAQDLLDLMPSRPQEVDVFDYQVLQLLYLRKYHEAIGLLQEALKQDRGSLGSDVGDYFYYLGLAQHAVGDMAAARQTFAEGRSYLSRFQDAVNATDNEVYFHAMLCVMSVWDGASDSNDCRSLDAIAASTSALAPGAREALARADALRGRTDAAIAPLKALLHANYYSYFSSAPLTPSLLLQDPVWDALRSDARFQLLAGAQTVR